MHKLITLSDQQYETAVEVMKTTRIESFSEFFRFLVLFYEQNQKRPAGRPKTTRADEDDDTPDEDDVPMYQNPDKNTTSPYSFNDLVVWYEANPSRGEMPARADLVIHKQWKKSKDAR
mgnify:FL=1